MKTEEAAPARRRASAKPFSALDRWSLKALLLGSAGLVILFFSLVVGLIEAYRQATLSRVATLISVDNAISDLCLKSTASMIDARRHEKDFALNFEEFGFDESKARYVTSVLTSVAEIAQNMNRVRALAGDPETTRLTGEVERALGRYGQGVQSWADKIGERGYLGAGLYGRMQDEAREIERLARGVGRDALLVRLLEVHRTEKDYLERLRDGDVEAHRARLRELEDAVRATPLPAATRVQLLGHLGRYRSFFGEYVLATEEIRQIKGGFLRAVQEADPLIEKLYLFSRGRVAEREMAIARGARLLRLSVLAFGCLVLLLAAGLLFSVALAVTRSVGETKAFAEQIAAGDLHSRLVPSGGKEFTSLATALNTMAQSLHDADVSRREKETALRESREKYQALVETSTDWIWAIDLAARHTFSNDRVADLLGVEPEELLKLSALDLLHPDDVPRVRALLTASTAAAAGWSGVVLRWRHKDGTYRWFESNAVPVFDARGSLAGFRGTDRDITERRKMEAELVKAQKLEAIGTLAGGIAHDFNNLLQGLFGYIALAKLSIDRGGRAFGLLEQAEKALSLSVNLTTQLLTFSKGGKPLKAKVALPGIIDDAAKFALSGSRCGYRFTAARDLDGVDADAGQLSQVIQNLVLNASEAMPQGGTVAITARNEFLAEGSNPLVPAGGAFVRVDVQDSGVGISAQNLVLIFDPYFTTKEKGSGLGLATAYSIVRAHDGFIDVASRPGEGSVFSLYLPASGAGETPETSAPPPAGGRKGRILVMDDEDLVREAAAGMIVELGHAVTGAANGEEAVALFRRAREEGVPFDVVLLDLTVKGGMGGEETLRRLLEIDPSVKSIVSSGYSEAVRLADFQAHGFTACLGKPYRIEALGDCLRSLLGPT